MFEIICCLIVTLLVGFGFGLVLGYELHKKDSREHVRRLIADKKDLKAEVDGLKHWLNVYRKLLHDAELKNTLIINELPKGPNVPKFDKF